MKRILLAVIFAGLMATTMTGTTIGLWSTGVCSGLNTNLAACSAGSGSLLLYGSSSGSVFDNNYQLTSRADGGTLGTNSATTEHAQSTYVADNVGASEWLGPHPLIANDAIGNYTYTTTFDLTGFVASSLILSLDVAAD